jgi:O-antigen/teichoic acid export membrane protein
MKSTMRKFWSAGAMLVIATVSTNVAAYILQAVLARWLSDDDFGALKWGYDWISYVLTPVIALQLAMTRYAAVFHAQEDADAVAALAWRATRRLAWYAGAFVVFVAAAHSWLVMGFRLEQKPALLWVAAGLVVIQLAGPVTGSLLQGLQRFKWLAAVYLVQGWGRVVFGLALAAAGFGAVGVMSGLLLAMVAATVLSLWALRGFWHHRKADHSVLDTRPVYNYFWPALVVSFSMATIGVVDMSFVRHYFEPEISGQYSKAKIVAQVFVFLVQPLSTVLFPRAAGDTTLGAGETRRLLWHALGVTGAIGLVAGVTCTLWPWLPVRLLTGPGNTLAETIVAPFVWALVPLGLAVLPLQFFLARAEFRRLLAPMGLLVVAYPAGLWLALKCWPYPMAPEIRLMAVLGVTAAAGLAALGTLVWSLWHVER